MTNALMELADRLEELTRLPDGRSLPDYAEPWGAECRIIREAATQLRTAAAEGGVVPVCFASPKALSELVCRPSVLDNTQTRLAVSLKESGDRTIALYAHPPTDSGAGRESAFVAEWVRRFGFLASRYDPSSIESIDEVACYLNSAGRDGERLDFLIRESARVQEYNGDALGYRVEWPDLGCHQLTWSETARDAIDTAIAGAAGE